MNSYQAAFGIGLSVAVLVILFYSLWPRRKKTSSVSPITTPDLASIAEKKSMEVFIKLSGLKRLWGYDIIRALELLWLQGL